MPNGLQERAGPRAPPRPARGSRPRPAPSTCGMVCAAPARPALPSPGRSPRAPPPRPRERGRPLCAGARGRRARGVAGLLGRRLNARRRRAATFGERHGGIVGVDGVENALVADLRLGDEADLAAQIRGARGATHGGGRGAPGAGYKRRAPPAWPPRGRLAARSCAAPRRRRRRGASRRARGVLRGRERVS